MGFTPNRKLFRLVFEGDLDGLEVTCRSSSVVVYKRIASYAARVYSSPPSDEDLAALADLYASFAAVLVEWNLEEPAGVPVPATLDGVETQEPALVNAVVTAWLDAVAEALGGRPSGQLVAELEASLPMEPLPV
jgi:hypothetical protein